MTVTELIARAAKRLIDSDPQLLGVRICPVTLSPEDIADLRKQIAALLGKPTYVALSVPGASKVDADRLYVSGDKSAAERATAWRNLVNVDVGEHLVYASVQVHGKAGGLQDCLTPIREDALRAEFAALCDEKGSGMPNGFGAALTESGILQRVSAVSLCEFGSAVSRDRRDNKWEACGHHLPLLNLARDAGLRLSTAAARLEENERVVSRAATGERASGITTGPVAQLRDAFRAEADDVGNRLKRVELTEVISEALGRKRAPKRSTQKKSNGSDKKEKNKKKGRSSRSAKKATSRVQDATEVLVNAAQGASKDPLSALERSAKKLTAADSGTSTGPSVDGSSGPQPSDDDSAAVWSKAQQASEFGALAQQVPIGLGAMLLHSLDSEGFGLVWGARESAAALIKELPSKTSPLVVNAEISDPAVTAALGKLIECRRVFAGLLLTDASRGLKALSTFIGAPLVALADRAFRSAAAALLAAGADFFNSVAASCDAGARRVALGFDTVEVRSRTGDSVVVLCPLHPLWLSQAMGRFDALLEQRDLSVTAKRLLVRSLSEAPVAPNHWPVAGSTSLQLSRPIGGLISYQSTPDELDRSEVASAVADVVSLFVDCSPHARYGLRIAVLGGDPISVVDGVAAALEAGAEIERVALHYRGAAQGDSSDKTDRMVASGRLALGALPTGEGDFRKSLKPHIVFHLAPPSAPGIAMQPAVPPHAGLGAGSGLLPTEFTVVESGLRARTPIDAARFPALASFEAVHALASGSQPAGAFARDAWAVSLRDLLRGGEGPSAGWDVVLAPRIGRRAPPGSFLLSHERVADQLSVAIVSREIAPAARALKEAFAALGVEDLRPMVLNKLAVHLASVTSQGVISPQRTGEQVLAASVLGVALRRELVDGDAFVAHFDGGSGTTLLGQEPATLDGAFAVGFGAKQGRLRVVLGYAALQHAVDAAVARGQLSGTLRDVFARLAASVELASSGDGAGAVAAREALNWLLWPALASAEQPGSGTERLLLQLERGVPCDVSVVAYLPLGAPALVRDGVVKLEKHPVALHALDVSTFESLVFGGGAATAVR